MKAVASSGVSIALACRTFGISEGCYRYERKLSDENAEIAEWLVKLTSNRRTWRGGLYFLYLRNVKGFGWNHKRVYRIYCELELNLRIRPKKRLTRWRYRMRPIIRGQWISWPTNWRTGAAFAR